MTSGKMFPEMHVSLCQNATDPTPNVSTSFSSLSLFSPQFILSRSFSIPISLYPSNHSIMERLDTIWDFDIDRYLNRFIPKNRLNLLPKPISWFLGYRESPRPPVGNILEWFWASTGAFLGLLVVSAVLQSPGLKSRGSPSIIASFVSIPQNNPIMRADILKTRAQPPSSNTTPSTLLSHNPVLPSLAHS